MAKSLDQDTQAIEWWADDGYAEVVRQTGWNLPKARREVK